MRERPNISNNANRSTDTKTKQKNKDFSSFLGDLVKRGWAAVHSTAEHWSIFESIELHCTSLICSSLH